MRIAIDARMMGTQATRGIGRYIEELIAGLLEVAPEHRFVLIVREKMHRFAGHASVETLVADVPWYGWKEQWVMPRMYAAARADVVHVPHWNVPVLYRGPLVMTIHDLLLRRVPQSANVSTRHIIVRIMKRIGYRFVLAQAVHRAKIILVPTAFVAKDVAEFYPGARRKICVSGEGMPRITATEVGEGHQSEHPYLLYVGAAYPHKGLQDVVRAWKRIAERYPRISWKIAGERDTFMRALEAMVQEQQLPRIQFLGRVTEEELQDLYEHAVGFIYPSHEEGFGLPPLEAIARGCPVLCSDAGPLPEVLGREGVIFFRSGDADGILQAVQELMRDPWSARRAVFRLGPVLAARHDWKRAASCTLGAYGDSHHYCPSWHEG